MYSFIIKIGNIVANIQSNHSYVKRICEAYLSVEDPNCKIIIEPHLLEKEKEALITIKNVADYLPEDAEDWFLEVYVLLHKLLSKLPEYDMLFLHGSAIRYKGKAYIFVAPSGTGKSTHTRLWQERFGDEVTVINDDKPFLAFRDNKVYLCGTPWRGKHNIGENLEAELAGICILMRGERDEIHSLNPSDAVQDIIQQCNLSRYNENVLKALDLIDRLLSAVPVYRLSCTPTQNAVEVSHKGMME